MTIPSSTDHGMDSLIDNAREYIARDFANDNPWMVIENCEEFIARLVDALVEARDYGQRFYGMAAALQDSLKASTKDTKRLDWLEGMKMWACYGSAGGADTWAVQAGSRISNIIEGDNLRSAIDKAMSGDTKDA